MEHDVNKPLLIKETVELVITPQALKILSQTNHTVEEFKEWALRTQKISYGGHNVMMFLEQISRGSN